ncbi:MAG TPA: hypothetical protein VFR86_24650 [Burkholderiaceae bacterium]|nr:hypothetical protein [Burkholderiaceae bacterium]
MPPEQCGAAAYLKDVLERIRSHSTAHIAELLPFNWKPLVA